MHHVNTICLCGSTKYMDDFHLANVELTKRGMSVITVSMAMGHEAQQSEAHVKELLDLVHFNKILRSDAVVVVGPGYIGFSTAREILWAQMQGKPVHSLDEHRNAHGEVIWASLLNDLADGYDDSENLVDKARAVLKEKAGNG